jgi:pyruvate/2-oxoglutarate dehydrogenase complex dihydrolipoamide dehydrogenase (E3) component
MTTEQHYDAIVIGSGQGGNRSRARWQGLGTRPRS